jgi:GT2 family glycosyltransferase
MKRVLVIVVTYNGLPWLSRCLASVTSVPTAVDGPKNGTSTSKTAQNAADGPENGTPPTLDVYVVDNDSTDGSADYIQSHFPAAKLVRAAENLGFSKANNLGMQYALDHGYDYVYLLNQDAWLEPGAMEKLVTTAEAHQEYAVLSPLQMTDGFKELDKQFARRCPVAAGHDVSEVKFVMAAHWLVPVKALKEVGLFNEELFPFYGQDDNWCHRARHKGYKIGIVPEARAVHDRADRKEDKDKLIFRNYYTGCLVRLANPNVPVWLSYIYILAFTLVKAVKYRSLKVFTYFFRLHSQFPAVRSLRKA